jgi:hypothetical protein
VSAEALAWSQETETATADYLPLPWSLLGLLAAVVVFGVGLPAFAVGIDETAPSVAVSAPATVTETMAPPTTETVASVPDVDREAPQPVAAAPTTPAPIPATLTQPAAAAPTTTAPTPVPVFTSAEDQRLVANLRGYYTTRSLADTDPAAAIRYGHEFCNLMQQRTTVDQADRDIQAATGWDDSTISMVTSSAVQAYSNC